MPQFKFKGLLTFLILAAVFLLTGGLLAAEKAPPDPAITGLQAQAGTPSATPTAAAATATPTAQDTIPPSTPLASLTPSQTLRPPPTFAPPTATPLPTDTPTTTPTPVYEVNVTIPGLNGAETATPSTTPGCEPREDWALTYTVQFGDALANIAEQYGTYSSELAAGNCLSDANTIYVGQELRVPGEAHPVTPEYVCTAWEALTPFDGAATIDGDTSITFNWRGPEATRYLLRIYAPDGSTHETVVDLRQNATVDMLELPWDGLHTWYVYPLDANFQQIPCPEGGPWTFIKGPGPTATPSPTVTPIPAPQVSFITSASNGAAPLTVEFFDTSRGEITGYLWDFGDGTTSDAQNPVHTYDDVGNYLVRLTVYGPVESEYTTTLIRVSETAGNTP